MNVNNAFIKIDMPGAYREVERQQVERELRRRNLGKENDQEDGAAWIWKNDFVEGIE